MIIDTSQIVNSFGIFSFQFVKGSLMKIVATFLYIPFQIGELINAWKVGLSGET